MAASRLPGLRFQMPASTSVSSRWVRLRGAAGGAEVRVLLGCLPRRSARVQAVTDLGQARVGPEPRPLRSAASLSDGEAERFAGFPCTLDHDLLPRTRTWPVRSRIWP